MIGAAVKVSPDKRNDQGDGSQWWENRRNLHKKL